MTTPRVSIVIPTKNSASTIERCLLSIQQQTYRELDIVVVDNYSSDNTVAIAQRFTSRVVLQGSERSTQRNRGAHDARGDYLLFIDSDMELSPTVIAECVQCLQADPQLQGISIPEESFGTSYWAACKQLERRLSQDISWLRAARCFRKTAFHALGGFRSDLVGAEDFDLSQRLTRMYGSASLTHVRSIIYHNEQNLSLRRTCWKKFYYGKTLRPYANDPQNRSYFITQANPLRRYAILFAQPRLLAKQPLISAGMIFMKICEFVAGGMGYLASRMTP